MIWHIVNVTLIGLYFIFSSYRNHRQKVKNMYLYDAIHVGLFAMMLILDWKSWF